MTNSVDNIGPAIRQARKRSGLSQEKLAELLDVTPTHIKHIESGRRKPSADLLFAAAQRLHFSLDALIDADASPEPTPTWEIMNMLDGCTDRELRLITEIVQAIRNNR